jgi:hypothetical protein
MDNDVVGIALPWSDDAGQRFGASDRVAEQAKSVVSVRSISCIVSSVVVVASPIWDLLEVAEGGRTRRVVQGFLDFVKFNNGPCIKQVK